MAGGPASSQRWHTCCCIALCPAASSRIRHTALGPNSRPAAPGPQHGWSQSLTQVGMSGCTLHRSLIHSVWLLCCSSVAMPPLLTHQPSAEANKFWRAPPAAAGISDTSLLNKLLTIKAPVSVYGSPLVSAIITAKWHEGVKWHLLNQGIWFLLYFGLFMAFQVGVIGSGHGAVPLALAAELPAAGGWRSQMHACGRQHADVVAPRAENTLHLTCSWSR
jgi:hypothetical protein